CRRDELLYRNRIRGVLLVILPAHPMYRRVEVCAGVFAALEVVPVPCRAAIVVFRYLFDTERPVEVPLGWQLEYRSFVVQGVGEVDDADVLCGNAGDELV